MNKIFQWINNEIKKNIHFWYYWIGVICGIAILNFTIVSKYAPYGVHVVISMLLLIIGVYYVSVFYNCIYKKYKLYMDKSELRILRQIGILENHIEEITEGINENIEENYQELSSKIAQTREKLSQSIKENSEKYERLISEKFAEQIQLSNDNLDILQEDIKELLIKEYEEFKRIEAEVYKVREKIAHDIKDNSEYAEKLILNKFAELIDNNDSNLNVIQNDIKKLSNYDRDGFAKIETKVSELGDNTISSIDDIFKRLSNNFNKRQMEVIRDINEIIENVSEEIKVVGRDIIGKANQNRIDIIEKTCEEIEHINKVYEQVTENHFEIINEYKLAEKQLQNKLDILQKVILEEIVKLINKSGRKQQETQNERDKAVDNKFNNVNQNITKLNEILSNNLEKINANMLQTLSIANSIEESAAVKNDDLYNMLEKIYDIHSCSELNAKNLSNKQDYMTNKISNMQNQIETLNALVKILNNGKAETEKRKKETTRYKKQPNRTEKIIDKENQSTLLNTFKNDILHYSEMLLLGKKVFSAEYNPDGSIKSSKNFNNKGDVTLESTYYPNGQVKERKEKVKENGKIVNKVTRFNKNGSKI